MSKKVIARLYFIKVKDRRDYDVKFSQRIGGVN